MLVGTVPAQRDQLIELVMLTCKSAIGATWPAPRKSHHGNGQPFSAPAARVGVRDSCVSNLSCLQFRRSCRRISVVEVRGLFVTTGGRTRVRRTRKGNAVHNRFDPRLGPAYDRAAGPHDDCMLTQNFLFL